jgi:diketogulonate reductase-like aldo/keto reductase
MNEFVSANGAKIPRVGLGTWPLAGVEAVDLISHALSIGYRQLDTAARYANEVEVGQAIRASSVPRGELFVTTKVWPTELASAAFRKSVEDSLSRLSLDYVDLLLIHWPNPAIPMEEYIGALNAAASDGLARHVGVSNFPPRLFEQAVALSRQPLVANEVERHPYLHQPKIYDACRKAGAALIAYSPFARGRLLFSEPAIVEAAAAHRVTPGQVVLRWNIQSEGVVVVPRTMNRERMVENLAVTRFELSAAEMKGIDHLAERNLRVVNFEFVSSWE